MTSLLEELKRRRVFRVAAAYVVGGWLVLQIADTLGDALGLPDWTLRFVLFVLVIGFVPAMIVAWVYQLTPDGLRRDTGESAGDDAAVGRRLTIATLGLAVVALAFWAWNTPSRQTPAAPDATDARRAVTTQAGPSLAVLPFEAFSDDETDAFFGKGVAEELLNSMAQFPELKVAARTSTFALAEQGAAIDDVGAQLGVAYVLEGSVRKSGDRIRVTAQLIRSDDGRHLWSDSYERELDDLFAIQDDIVAKISRVLQIRLGVGAGAERASAEGVDPRAYEQYLRGLDLWGQRDGSFEIRQDALAAFRLATEIDPDFADAWAAIGNAGAFSSADNFGEPYDTYFERTDMAFAKALALDPDNAAAHGGLVQWHIYDALDLDKAAAHLEAALRLAPNRAETHYAGARFHALTGDLEAADNAFRRAISLDPLNVTLRRVQANFFASHGMPDRAMRFVDDCLATNCLPGRSGFFLVMIALKCGDTEAARQWLEADNLANEVNKAPTNPETIVPKFIIRWIQYVIGNGTDEGHAAELNSLVTEQFQMEMSGLPFWGDLAPPLVRVMDRDTYLDLLEANLWAGHFVSTPWGDAGSLGQFPEWVLRHPRYHAIWARDGFARLATLRKRNGFLAGLPLPVED